MKCPGCAQNATDKPFDLCTNCLRRKYQGRCYARLNSGPHQTCGTLEFFDSMNAMLIATNEKYDVPGGIQVCKHCACLFFEVNVLDPTPLPGSTTDEDWNLDE